MKAYRLVGDVIFLVDIGNMGGGEVAVEAPTRPPPIAAVVVERGNCMHLEVSMDKLELLLLGPFAEDAVAAVDEEAAEELLIIFIVVVVEPLPLFN